MKAHFLAFEVELISETWEGFYEQVDEGSGRTVRFLDAVAEFAIEALVGLAYSPFFDRLMLHLIEYLSGFT